MQMSEFILTRIAENDDYLTCCQGDKSFILPKASCRMVQQSYLWDRKLPDTIVIKIPDTLADRLGLFDCEED